MSHYCGIDLHSNNHFVVVIDEDDTIIRQAHCAQETRREFAWLK